MEHEYSAEDMEVARILKMLPQLMWQGECVPPCTHDLQWGARKRRSAGNPEARPPPPHFPTAPPPPPPPPRPPLFHPAAAPLAVGELDEACRADLTVQCHTAAVEARTNGCDSRRGSPVAVAVELPVKNAAAPEASSPEAPLDFGLGGEELDCEAQNRPPGSGGLRREVAEAEQYSRGRSCAGPLPTLAIRDPRVPDHGHPASHIVRQKQPFQDLWPKQWLYSYPVVHQLVTGFSIHPHYTLDHQAPAPAPAPARNHQCERVGCQPLGQPGDEGAGTRPCTIPDLNARVDDEFDVE